MVSMEMLFEMLTVVPVVGF